MTTLKQRSATALLVVDMQAGVVADAHERDAVVARIAALVDRARAAGLPVIWVQHADEELVEGSADWAIVPELQRVAGEALVAKHYGDAFEDTDLEAHLARLQVGKLLVAGAQTDACIRSTLHGALVRGYDTVLVADAHTTSDRSQYGAPPPGQVMAHTNLYWTYQSAPGREAGTVRAADIDFETRA